MEFDVLLLELANRYFDKLGKYPNKTKLIKLAYLAEIFYKRWTNNRMTEVEWIFLHYGPYVKEYDHYLKAITNTYIQRGDFVTVITDSKSINTYNGDIEIALQRALEFSRNDLNDILDFIYFDTEPMLSAVNRGEVLNFNCVLSESHYKTIKIQVPEETISTIRSKVKKWLSEHAK